MKKNAVRLRHKRFDLKTEFTAESLMDVDLLKSTQALPVKIYPDLVIFKLGGQSCFDYGKEVIYPLVKEIVELNKTKKLLVATGGGTRARHVYKIGLDLGMPTGVLATLGKRVASQNAIMLYVLLAKYGGVRLSSDHLETLPHYLGNGLIPIMPGMPDYGYFEPPSDEGNIPANRTDVGTFLLGEIFGVEKVIMVKDEEGLYDRDPKKDKKAKLIKKITAQELLDLNLKDLAVERSMLKMMVSARFTKKVQIINGHVKGNLTRAVGGEEIGSLIYTKA